MNIKVYLLNAFGLTPKGGNPAGVVLHADKLTDEQKKYIAKEIGFSETAFVEKSSKADFKVTFFTPTGEVDLCGHATIAVYSLLLQKNLITARDYSQELKAGILTVSIAKDGLITMEQALPEYREILSIDEVLSAFTNKQRVKTISDLPIQIVSTGVKDIFLPIQTKQMLNNLKPDFGKMSELSKRTHSVSVHAFTLDTKLGVVAECRNFAPLYGINEEAATGSSTGALACYLYTYGKLDDKKINKLIFEQGYSMKKPSQITASLRIGGGIIKKVQIGGTAQIIGEKFIDL